MNILSDILVPLLEKKEVSEKSKNDFVEYLAIHDNLDFDVLGELIEFIGSGKVSGLKNEKTHQAVLDLINTEEEKFFWLCYASTKNALNATQLVGALNTRYYKSQSLMSDLGREILDEAHHINHNIVDGFSTKYDDPELKKLVKRYVVENRSIGLGKGEKGQIRRGAR